MLDKSIVEKVLLQAAETGADFAELFAEQGRDLHLSMGAGRINAATSGLESGAGIRLFKGDLTSYAYTNDLSEAGLMRAAAKAAAAIAENRLIKKINLNEQRFENNHKFSIDLFGKSRGELIDFMRRGSDRLYAESPLISRADVGLSEKQRRVLVANSDGLWAEDERRYARYSLSVIAEDGSEKFSCFRSRGGMCGCELFDAGKAEALAAELVKDSVEMLRAENCPAGRLPVVICPEIGGILFHEACGHSLEATAVAKNASVFAGRLGAQIANEKVTLIDDGTLPNHWGSINMDDEGHKTQRNVLIENGILKSYLVDRFNGRKMGMAATGSARRQDYTYVPTSRMTNTFVAAGTDNPEEIVASTPYGIYVAQIKGGSVQPQSGEFNFSVNRAYLIEKGRITKPVKGAKLIGTGAEVLMNIDMVGSDLAVGGCGICGSVSGGVPVGNGQPTLRVKEMTVGGQK